MNLELVDVYPTVRIDMTGDQLQSLIVFRGTLCRCDLPFMQSPRPFQLSLFIVSSACS